MSSRPPASRRASTWLSASSSAASVRRWRAPPRATWSIRSRTTTRGGCSVHCAPPPTLSLWGEGWGGNSRRPALDLLEGQALHLVHVGAFDPDEARGAFAAR